MLLTAPFFMWNHSFRINNNDIGVFLSATVHVSIRKSTFIIVNRYFSSPFSFENPGFHFSGITHSNPYFSFNAEVGAIDLRKIQQSIVAGDNYEVCFVVGYVFQFENTF